jgi:putative SOS response-associated peptidase YedK
MCGRFSLISIGEVLADRFKVDVDENLRPRYNISPGQKIPIIVGNEMREAVWGLVPHWSKEPSGFINARSETLSEKNTFKEPFENKRCLIPADGFYEWTKDKVPYRITLKDNSLFAFAGIYDLYQEVPTCAIITVPPNEFVKKVHHRMPAILERKDEAVWLAKNPLDKLQATLKPYSGDMKVIQISNLINSSKHESPEVIKPASSLLNF